jgi:MFS family permease
MHQMSPVQVGYWVGIFLGGFVVGALCGLLPLLVGLKKQRRGLALAGWISCVVAGLILGLLLAIPVALVFTVVILFLKPRGGREQPPSVPADEHDRPAARSQESPGPSTGSGDL